MYRIIGYELAEHHTSCTVFEIYKLYRFENVRTYNIDNWLHSISFKYIIVTGTFKFIEMKIISNFYNLF